GCCTTKDSIKHRLGQLAGKRVLLTRVKRRDQDSTSVQPDLDSVCELWPRSFTYLWLFNLNFNLALSLIWSVESDRADGDVEGQPAERHDDAYSAQQIQLAKEVRAAVGDLGRQRFVSRRRTTNRRGYITIKKLQSIVAIC